MEAPTQCSSTPQASQPQVQPITESPHLHLHPPPCYIQSASLRPNGSNLAHDVLLSLSSIPTVDLSISDPILHVRHACLHWGAFHVTNHGVPPYLLEEMRSMCHEFFQCETEEKLRFSCDLTTGPTAQGYGSKILRDFFNHYTLPEVKRDFGKWPDFIPNYREVVAQYSTEMKGLAQRILSMVSQSLQLPPSCMQNIVGEEVHQRIIVNYYSPCPQRDLALGIQAHSDMGAISLLIQDDDVVGLEVLKDDKWVPVQPLKNSIVVILSDMTEIITNGEYKSAVHRAAVNADRARLSVATFYEPSKTRRIFPAPQLVSARNPAKCREVVYGDFVKSWQGRGPEGKRNGDF